MNTDAIVVIEGLEKRYRDAIALDGIDLRVPRGSVFGYLGPNGAGKTTTIRLMVGLQRPTRGTVTVLGAPVHPDAEILERIGALVERPAFYPFLSARENLVALGLARGMGRRRAREAADGLLDMTGMAGAARRRVGGFSTGMRQRLGIASALLGHPDLVVLDEPTAGLDPEGVIAVRELIARLAAEGTTVFLSTHQLSEAEQLCTDVAILVAGRIRVSGPVAELTAARPRVRLRFGSERERDRATEQLRKVGMSPLEDSPTSCVLDGAADGSAAIAALAAVEIYPLEVATSRVSLEDAYLDVATAEHGLSA